MRRLVSVAVLALSISPLTACGGSNPTAPEPVSATHPDPPTIQALLRIARQFNDQYAANDAGAVYDR